MTNGDKKLEDEENADRKNLESGRGSPYASHIHLESWKGSEIAGWTLCIFKGAASPRATIRLRDGSRHEFGPAKLGKLAWSWNSYLESLQK